MSVPPNAPSIPASNPKVSLSFSTVAMVLGTLLGVAALVKVAPLFLPVFMGGLLAVALLPIVRFLRRRGISKGLAISIVTLLLVLMICLILWMVVPVIARQAESFIENWPRMRQDLLHRWAHHGALKKVVDGGAQMLNPTEMNFDKILGAGNRILGVLAEVAVILICAVYLLLDGSRLIAWCRAFFDRPTQMKIDQTLHETGEIVFAYVVGQFITSAIAFIFVFAILSALGVKNVLLLATLAGLFDVLPVLGFVLAVVPAMLFALEVSNEMPFAVLAAYLIYHGIENYFIVPLVYGKKLRVSSFVVFVALLAAGLIGGVEGAIVVLPIVASYPIIERIWLKPYLRRETIAVHEAVEEEDRDHGRDYSSSRRSILF